MIHSPALAPAAFVAVLATFPPAVSHAATEAAVQPLVGVYRLSSPDAQAREVIARAIEPALRDVPGILRPFARNKLRDLNPVVEEVSIASAGEGVRVGFNHQVSYESALDGEPVLARSPGGGRVRLSQRIREGRLLQLFVNQEGRRTNSFELSADGRWLDLEVELRSRRLSEPVRYMLRLERVADSGASRSG